MLIMGVHKPLFITCICIFFFSKLNDMRWLPFICEIYLPPPSSSVKGRKSFRIQLVHRSLKGKVNEAVWVSFQLGNLGGLKAGVWPLGKFVE